MPKTRKPKGVIETFVDKVTNSTNPHIKPIFNPKIEPLGLNLDLGRQDLNENFHKIQEKINELIRKN